MARVTVEDCIDKVDNRFDLVLLAAHRARMISSGSQLTIDRDNDKNPVVSLREIAETGDRWRSADTGMRYSGMIAGPAYEAGSAMAFMNSGDRARRALSGEDAP